MFRTYFDLIRSEFTGLDANGKIGPRVDKDWLVFMLMFIQLGPVFLARSIEEIL